MKRKCQRSFALRVKIQHQCIKNQTGQRMIFKYFVLFNVSSIKWKWRIIFCLICLMQLFKEDSNIVQWKKYFSCVLQKRYYEMLQKNTMKCSKRTLWNVAKSRETARFVLQKTLLAAALEFAPWLAEQRRNRKGRKH